jgi:hypothetical protein
MEPSEVNLTQLERHAAEVIRTAFANVDPPAASDVQSEHCPECHETNALLAGKRWQDIAAAVPPTFSVQLLTVAAFRCYLPALMTACMEARDELAEVADFVVASLSPNNPENWKPDERVRELLRTYDRDQLEAICAFLGVMEARERCQYGPDVYAFVLVSKPLARAIAFWAEQRKP